MSNPLNYMQRPKGITERMHECEFVVGFSRNGIHILKDRYAENNDISFQELLKRLAEYSTYLSPIQLYEPLIKYMEKKVDSLKSFL